MIRMQDGYLTLLTFETRHHRRRRDRQRGWLAFGGLVLAVGLAAGVAYLFIAP